jgi:uncharacterized protein (DUF302 family)
MQLLYTRTRLILMAAMFTLTVVLLLGPVASVQASEDKIMLTVSDPFDTVVTNLKRAITGQNMVVVKEVPLQQMMAMVGLRTPKILTFEIFHPRYGKQLYEANQAALIEAPLRIIVREDGNDVTLEYRLPSATFAEYSGLDALAEELDTVLANIVSGVNQ